ncbi:DNA polymerase III subunit gamma/tau [Holospora obtusa F1]|uniref:DNA polymerase III subunit gamma/tau n=1 Tax=Holospora obtusa F1 TaxID=1399147 RepID=W6TGC1_HOLOB|nr:hypothetical protein [Holospora obtusa]ETZ06890.1 DNA polymerase III subunit gamma/tau [Holospora obtusa F1]
MNYKKNDYIFEKSQFLGFLLGYEDIVQQFQKAFKEGRLPHSWLFLGEDGLGKRTLCYALSCIAFGYEGSLKLENSNHLRDTVLYHQVINHSYPEFYVISLPVTLEQIRSIKKRLVQTAFSVSWKIVILPRLDSLRHECVNALLKIVEDPPKKSLFLFTAIHTDFPSTLLSRCCVYPLRACSKKSFLSRLDILLEHLKIENLKVFTENTEGSLKIFEEWLYMFTRGNLGKAIRLLSSGKVDLIQRTWSFLDDSFNEGPCLLPLDLSGHLYQNIDVFQEIVFLWMADKLFSYAQHQKRFLLLDRLLCSIQIWFQQAKTFHMDSAFFVQKIISNVGLISQKWVS